MKTLFLSAEVAPYVSVGGLSQVMYFLPRALIKLGHDVRICTPLYGLSKIEESSFVNLCKFDVPITHGTYAAGAELPHDVRLIPRDPDDTRLHYSKRDTYLRTALEYGSSASEKGREARTVLNSSSDVFQCTVYLSRPNPHDAPVYFFHNEEFFQLRENVFGYRDDHVRFAFFSKACLEWMVNSGAGATKTPWQPDIIHCHDWHTSYAVDLARRSERYRKIFQTAPIVLTVHNFRYQGNTDFRFIPESEKDSGRAPLEPLTSKMLIRQNALKRGILSADFVTTVSPTHAREVLSLEYGEGLERVLKRVQGKLRGILNGLDVEEFNPRTDSEIKKTFSLKTFRYARPINKADLQKEFGLPLSTEKPLLAFVGRLTSQKGVDLILEMLPYLFAEHPDVQMIILGGGDEKYRNAIKTLKKKFPKQLGAILSSNFHLPRKIFAGADMMLIPSIFEPGGIVALEALRYGAVPIVRRTGGLNDSISDFSAVSRKGNGISFTQKSPWSLYGAIIAALMLYRQKELWNVLVSNCLSSDFSWEHVAREYVSWYRKALIARKRVYGVINKPSHRLQKE